MINLKELENSLTEERVIELVTELGSDEYRETDSAIIFKTICHNHDVEDASFKLYYYKKNKQFHCYTECGCNFNIYELFKKRFELLNTPYNFYRDIVLKISGGSRTLDLENGFFDVYKSDYDKYEKKTIEVELTPINPSILNIFSSFCAPEWLEDGISEESMRTFQIKYSIPQNKIVIPHYDYDGNLIGIRCRALNPEDIEIGKYMPMQIGDKIYSHPLGYNLYGLNLNKENIRRRKMAIVPEAEKSVLQYETMFGRENNICVAACGSNFSLYQFQLLRRAGAERIIIAFDKEGKNWKEREVYREKLYRICKRYSNECLMGFITDTKNLLELKDSPTDRGKEIFKQLYKEGVVWI